MKIRFDSRNYLKRARELLDSGKEPFLFYAAYELRCGVECRLIEYSSGEAGTFKGSDEWKINRLAKGLKKAALVQDKIASIRLIPKSASIPERTFYYTPVTKQLQREAHGLGNLLHARKPPSLYSDGGLELLRDRLEKIYSMLSTATAGTLLAPPVWNREKRLIFYSKVPMQATTKVLRNY